MKNIGLSEKQLELILSVLKTHPGISKAVVFGSRAKGNFRDNSDIDITLFGEISLLEAEKIASDLDLLPLCFKFDVIVYELTANRELREHIDRVGSTIYQCDR